MTRSMIKLNNYFKSIKTIKILIKTIKNLPNKYKQNKKKQWQTDKQKSQPLKLLFTDNKSIN